MSKGHILIVDDDQDIRETMAIILQGGAYSVDSAANSEEALNLLDSNRPDLIIMDVMMSHADEGFQLSYKLKNNPKYAEIPIIMITSVAQKSGFKFSPSTDGDFLPVDDLLEKPVKPNVLLEKVATHVKK